MKRTLPISNAKYPRTPYLSYNDNISKDSPMILYPHDFENKNVIVSVKLDGENTTMTHERVYARSLNTASHESRDWIRTLHGQLKFFIPNGYKVCGENMYAKHSIHYKNLDTYFYVFSVFNEFNECLCWPDTVSFCKKIGLKPVYSIYNGPYDKNRIQNAFDAYKQVAADEVEGYIIRNADRFLYDDFHMNVGKFVSKKFKEELFNTDDHWMTQKVVKNIIKK